MDARYVSPFVAAAVAVLRTETHSEVIKGDLRLETGPLISDAVTALIGVTGAVQGVVLYNFGAKTAKEIVAAMTGEPVPIWDKMAESGIAELGNVITGQATIQLEQAGYSCNISPPTVVVGRDTTISTVHINRLVIPLETRFGAVSVHVALRN